MKSLVVEDDFTSRLLIQKFLEPYGETHIAVNGKEAVKAFRSALNMEVPYDLVCLDIMMPEMDGQEALIEIRKLDEDSGRKVGLDAAIVIMTTALSDSKNVTEAFKEQCDAYLLKPIDANKLKEQLKTFDLI